MTLEARLWIVAIAAFAAFLVLGYYVTHTAELPRIDIEAAAIRGQATGLAAFLTFTGRGPFIAAASVAIGALLWYARIPLRILAIVVVSQIASQIAIEGMKHIFVRHRPDYWLIGLERGFSYPSGHASTAVTFFCTWAIVTLLLPLSRDVKLLVAIALFAWAAGIAWSRLALGAHYLTDVTGGTLFGIAWMCAVAAIYVHYNGALSLTAS